MNVIQWEIRSFVVHHFAIPFLKNSKDFGNVYINTGRSKYALKIKKNVILTAKTMTWWKLFLFCIAGRKRSYPNGGVNDDI